jgi:hypothetical protein
MFENITGFDWDEANLNKNWNKHKVSHFECEEIFFNEPLIIRPDYAHSQTEARFAVLGKTYLGRLLFAVFTIRESKIRVISARDMSGKEGKIYYEKT